MSDKMSEVEAAKKYCPHADECIHPCDVDECFLETIERPNGPINVVDKCTGPFSDAQDCPIHKPKLAASKLTPAAVAGDATQCSVCNHALHEGDCNAATDCLCVQYPSLRGVKVADPVGEREGEFSLADIDAEASAILQENGEAWGDWDAKDMLRQFARHRLNTHAALASKPSAEGIPERPKVTYKALFNQAKIPAHAAIAHFEELEGIISDLHAQIVELTAADETIAELLGSTGSTWYDAIFAMRVRAEAAEAELAALKLSSARIEEETRRKDLESVKGLRLVSHNDLIAKGGSEQLNYVEAVQWPYVDAICKAEAVILSLIPTSPESQEEGE